MQEDKSYVRLEMQERGSTAVYFECREFFLHYECGKSR